MAPVLWLAASLWSGCAGEGAGGEAEVPVGTAVGQRAPALQGSLASGEGFSLDDERGAPVVLEFYQGGYCGLCRERLSRLQQHLEGYRSLGARVVAVAADPPPAAAELSGQLGLRFPLVSADSATLARWLPSGPGDAAAGPATFVVDGVGRIAFRHLGRNAGDRASDATLLTVLEGLRRD